jgi:hypothetical protein
MIFTLVIGIVVEIIGAILLTYNLGEGSTFGFSEYWIGISFGLALLIAGLIILYAAFRPTVFI